MLDILRITPNYVLGKLTHPEPELCQYAVRIQYIHRYLTPILRRLAEICTTCGTYIGPKALAITKVGTASAVRIPHYLTRDLSMRTEYGAALKVYSTAT